jgi:hypothetical protein
MLLRFNFSCYLLLRFYFSLLLLSLLLSCCFLFPFRLISSGVESELANVSERNAMVQVQIEEQTVDQRAARDEWLEKKAGVGVRRRWNWNDAIYRCCFSFLLFLLSFTYSRVCFSLL